MLLWYCYNSRNVDKDTNNEHITLKYKIKISQITNSIYSEY